MAFRFRKSIKVLPGVRLNISKSGVSGTLGPRGSTVSVGKTGVHGNLGIPGTGLSYRTRLDKKTGRTEKVVDVRNKSLIVAYALWLIFGAFGAHRMYLGRLWSGIAMTALLLASASIELAPVILVIWWILDVFLIPSIAVSTVVVDDET